jgi:hypothetical protein
MSKARHLVMLVVGSLVALPFTTEAKEGDATQQGRGDAKQGGRCSDDPGVFEVTDLGSNQYLFYQRVLLDAPINEVWAEIRNAERVVAIALPAAEPTFMWLNGGGPETVPSLYQFSVGDATLLEEVAYRSDPHHQVLYRLVNPAFGMQQYYAGANLTRCGQKTTLEYVRYLELQPGVSVTGLEQTAAQEFMAIEAYFNGAP